MATTDFAGMFAPPPCRVMGVIATPLLDLTQPLLSIEQLLLFEFCHTNDFMYMHSEGTAGTNRNRGTDRYATGQGTGHWAQPRRPLD
jgi:hypothetical protein